MTVLNQVSPGRDIPHDINVIVEIPTQSGPVKYEVDKDSGVLSVDRFLATAMYYPCNYGYMPGTLSDDGDPVDVLVVTPSPLLSGAIIRCRPIGLLQMTDEHGPDPKVLAVPMDKLTPLYSLIKTSEDLPAQFLASIRHFFEHYKDLEEGKWVKVEGWQGPDAAKKEISNSVQRYKEKR